MQKKTKRHSKDGSTCKTLDVMLDSTVTSQSQKQEFGQINASERIHAESPQSITEIRGKGYMNGESEEASTELDGRVSRNGESQLSTIEYRRLTEKVERQDSIEGESQQLITGI